MIDINFIRENPEEVKKKIALKKAPEYSVDDFLAIDTHWRMLTAKADDLRSQQKKASAEKNIDQAKLLKIEVQKTEAELNAAEYERLEILAKMPNLPADDVPVGKSSNDNIVVREVGEKTKFDFTPVDYLTLAEKLDLIDMERGAKVSGSRFGYIKNELVLLEFALVRYAFETLQAEGFTPIVPPVMVKEEMMRAMGFVDRDSDQAESYYFKDDKLYLVGTSEQSVGPIHANETFNENELPKRYASFSTCFRREAGSYGKDTKGILRVHQFDKIEMISFAHPDKSQDEHLLLLSMEEKMMQALGIPYRVLRLCTGDLGWASAGTYDIEAWMPGQNNGKGEYRETHSTSNTREFQARRLQTKFKSQGEDGKSETRFVHVLNGTGFAIGRTLIALIENGQQKDGSINIPSVLQPYMGGIARITR